MNSVTVTVGVIYAILAVGVLLVGALASTRRLPGNSFIGIRVPEVRHSRDIWEQSHAVAGPLWVFSGLALLFGALSVFFVHSWMWMVPVAAFLLGVYGIGAGANVGARRAALLDAAENDAHAEAAGVRPPAVDTAAALRAASARDTGAISDTPAVHDSESGNKSSDSKEETS